MPSIPKITAAYAVTVDRLHKEEHEDKVRAVHVRVVVQVEDYDNGDWDLVGAWVVERSVAIGPRLAAHRVSTTERFIPPQSTELSAKEQTGARLAVALHNAGVDTGCVRDLELVADGTTCPACNGEGGKTEYDEDGPWTVRCERCGDTGDELVPEEAWAHG